MTESSPGGAARRAELAANLAGVRSRIASACAAAGRDPAGITLIAITKTFPARDVRLLSGLGVRDVGENRDQEAAPKAAACADLAAMLTWHFVGQLQTNKCASVVRYAGVVHSVDRMRLIFELGKQARRAGRVITCLVQVSLDAGRGTSAAGRPAPPGTPARAEAGGRAGRLGVAAGVPHGPRGGADPAEVPALAEAVAAEEGLTLGGIMAVAPLGVPAAQPFALLPQIAASVRQVRPGAGIISAGMSGDLEEAIAAGATHVRVGTALLGSRPGFVR